MNHHALSYRLLSRQMPHTDGIDYHCPKIKLQFFLCPRTNTGNSDTDQLDNFAGSDAIEYFETSKQFQQKCRHSVIRANRQVHHQFDDKKICICSYEKSRKAVVVPSSLLQAWMRAFNEV